MSTSLLQRCGEALYGPLWQSALASDLNVSDRTVRRWVAGADVPDGVLSELGDLCRRRSVDLAGLAREIQSVD